jgi:hypothetical protein
MEFEITCPSDDLPFLSSFPEKKRGNIDYSMLMVAIPTIANTQQKPLLNVDTYESFPWEN